MSRSWGPDPGPSASYAPNSSTTKNMCRRIDVQTNISHPS